MPSKKPPFGDVSGPIFQIKDLTGGVNLRPTPTTIKPNQALLLQNVSISNVGELGIYPGWKGFSLAAYDAVVLADGATSFWRLITDATDSATPAHNGTIGGTITFATASPISDTTNAALFDGSTSVITVSPAATTTTFTIEFWVNRDASQSSADGTILDNAGDTQGLFVLNGGAVDFFYSGSNHNLGSLSAGTYHHVVVSVSAGTGTLYVDGVAISGTYPSVPAYTPAKIGSNGANFLKGNLSRLAVYNGIALTAAQALAHFNAATTNSSLGTRRAQGGKRIYLKNATFTLIADNGLIFKPSDTGVWGLSVSSGWNTTNAIDFVYDRDQVAVFDANTVPQKSLDGVTWTQLGITAPLILSLSAVNGGSLVNGDVYEVTATYFNSATNQESNESPVQTVTPAGANLTIAVTTVASADPQVTNIKLYARDKTAGEASRRLVTTVANANGTTNITSNTWSAGVVPPGIGMASVALAMKFGVVWKNRWWGADITTTNRLRFSQVFANNQWPDTFYVDIPFERGEGIQALMPLGDILVVFGYTKFYLILGQTSLDFEVRPGLGAQTGALGFRGVDVLENSIVHAGAPGVYIYNGAYDQLLTFPIDPAWQSMMGNTTAAELSILPIAYHKLRKELRVAVPTVFPTGARGEWVLDLNRTNAPVPQGETQDQAWFATDRTIGGYIQWDGNESNSNNYGRIFSWSPTVVTLYEERTGQSANGNDLTAQYQGYMLPLGIQFGRIVETYLEYKPDVQTSFSVSLVVDGTTLGPQALNLNTSTGGGLYGTGLYGTATYGGGVTRAMLPMIWPLSADGHAAQVRMTYIGQGSPKFYTYGHNIVAEALPRGL